MPDLGLQAQARKHFDFLTFEKGYKCVDSTPCRVRFESPTAFIELVFDGDRSYELGLLIGKTGSKNPPFSIGDILRAPLCRYPRDGWLDLAAARHSQSGPTPPPARAAPQTAARPPAPATSTSRARAMAV